MNKKKLILSICLSLLAILILVVSFILINKPFESKSEGEITVELIDLNGNKEAKKIEFYKNDTLIEILENNYDNVVVTDGMIMSIDTLQNKEDWSSYISILVDGEYSMVGILDIEFTDGTIITFKMEVYVAIS